MDLDRYNETLDFVSSANFKNLTMEEQKLVIATYENAYRSSVHMGQGIAVGKAVKNAVELIDTGNKEADLISNTQKWSDVVESYIRCYPDQWVWMHRRWKTQK